MDELISKKAAKAAGLKHYFNGTPCARGHVAKRYTSCGQCFLCAEEQRKRWRSSNPEKTRELRREWRRKNPEREKESHTKSNAKWWSEKKDLINAERRRVRKEEDGEKQRAHARERYAANPEHHRELNERWRRNNLEKWSIIGNRRRARKRNAPGSYTTDDITDIFKMQRSKCAYCRQKFPRKRLHIDHIIALAKGGSNERKNLQLVCRSCNSRKSIKDPIDHAQSLGLLV